MDGQTDGRTNELRILRIDLLTDGYMELTDRSTDGCYVNGETADEHLLVQASKPCRPFQAILSDTRRIETVLHE